MSKAELAAEVGRLWGDVATRAKRDIRPLLEEQGVTMPQAIALHVLRDAFGEQTLFRILEVPAVAATPAMAVS